MKALRGKLPLVLAVLFALGWVVVWFVGSHALPSFASTYRVNAALPSVEGLGKGADVMIAGLPVGRVDTIERTSDGARVQMEVDKKYAPIPSDTRFAVRLRTLVGENYIELDPGHAKSELPSGGMLPASHAKQYVNVDEILNSLRGPTRKRARAMIQGLGYGVGGQGAKLNRVVADASGVIQNARPVLAVLARRHREVARLTDELGTVTAAIGQRGDALRQLAHMGRVTAESVAARDGALRSMLVRLPGTLRQVRSTTAILRTVTGHAAPVVMNLAAAVHELKPTVELLRPAAQEGQRVVQELGRTAPPLQDTVRLLRELAPPTVQALPQLQRTLCQVNPIIRYLSPYYREVPGILQGMGSSGNFYDANGHSFRLGVSIGEASIQSTYPPGTSGLVQDLLNSGALGREHKFGYNPYPLPGHAGESAHAGMPVNASQVKKHYPRIQADC